MELNENRIFVEYTAEFDTRATFEVAGDGKSIVAILADKPTADNYDANPNFHADLELQICIVIAIQLGIDSELLTAEYDHSTNRATVTFNQKTVENLTFEMLAGDR